MTKVKISILKCVAVFDYDYNSSYTPVHQSDWIEVDQEDLPKIDAGLKIMGDTSPLGAHRYQMFVKPIDELSIIQDAIQLYEKDAIRREQEKKERELAAMKKANTDRITKAISALKRMIKQIEQGPTKDEALKASSISSLQAQIDELKKEKKK